MLKVQKQVIAAILQYLSTKPFAEVFQLIGALQSLEEVKEETKEIKDEVKP